VNEPGKARYSASFNSAAILVFVLGLKVAARHSSILVMVAIIVEDKAVYN
jgi:hypothetical protein